jgi:hypothetical protein
MDDSIAFLRTKKKFEGLNGCLYKQGGHFQKVWRKRKFKLIGGALECYDMESNKLKKVFELNSHAKIEIAEENVDNMFNFTIKYDDKNDNDSVVYLASEASEERDIWLNAMLESQRGGPLIELNNTLLFEPFVPSIDLLVTYRTGETVMNDGNEVIIDHEKMCFKPLVAYKPMSVHDVFTILFIDSLLSINNDIPQRLLWMVTDIRGSDLTSGNEVLCYIRPTAPNTEEIHRYSTILIKQSAILTPAHFQNIKTIFASRDIDKSQFEMFNEYIDNRQPSAISVFRCIWNNQNIRISNKIDKFYYGMELRIQSSDDYFSKKRFIKIDSLDSKIYWTKSIEVGYPKSLELSSAIIINDGNLKFKIVSKSKKAITLFFQNIVDKNEWLEKVNTLI